MLIAFIWVVTGLLLSLIYRPYIYEHNLFDFHFADTIGSWVAVPVAVNFFYAVSSRYIPHYRMVLTVTLAYVFYEFLGLVNLHGVFDWYDILATLLSGSFTYLLIRKRARKE